MSIFLSEDERTSILKNLADGQTAWLYSSLHARVMRRAESPGLLASGDTVEWWHLVEESVCDAAMIHLLTPSARLGAWLRNVVMGIVQRPVGDWIGPWFRNHAHTPPMASLETGHVIRAVAAALDLLPELFTDAEQEQIRVALQDIAIPMVYEFMDHESEVHNHWCVPTAGLAFAGAVLEDCEAMDRAAWAYELYCNAFQPDGTYAESLQYANYAALTMMLTYEALTRRDPKYAARLKPQTYAGLADWAAYAHLYCKPMHNWGQNPIPRSINFGDSAAIFVPSADLLLHIASRCANSEPRSAKLARWLFDTAVTGIPDSPPYDRASFGFVNRPGFLSLPLLGSAVGGASPTELELPVTHAFGCGDVIARDGWNGRTVLAVRTGGEPMHVVSHVHGDINSLQLSHNRERLLVDPGHSCYRNLIRELDCASHTHNTCTFTIPGEPAERVQCGIANRKRRGDQYEPPLRPLSKLLLAASDGPIRASVSEAAGRYGAPIDSFVRIVILCGAHVVYVVDRIRSHEPVTARWNWLLNNRDNASRFDMTQPGMVELRRGDSGMRLCYPHDRLQRGGPQYAFVHDAYHPLPGQLGEGALGSGVLVHTRERGASTDRLIVHSIALDDQARIASWTQKASEAGDATVLVGRGGEITWSLDADHDSVRVTSVDRGDVRAWGVGPDARGVWTISRL